MTVAIVTRHIKLLEDFLTEKGIIDFEIFTIVNTLFDPYFVYSHNRLIFIGSFSSMELGKDPD